MHKLKKGEFTVIHTPTMEHLTAIELGVYAWLCYYTNQEGSCYPSLNTLAVRAKMTVRGVLGVLKRLEQKGAIKRVRRSGKKHGNTSTMYYLILLPPLVNVGNKPCERSIQPLVNVGNKNYINSELNIINYNKDKTIKINRGMERIGSILKRVYAS